MSASPGDTELYERIYQVVMQIPHGAVATYGDVALIVGGGCDGRIVGHALSELSPERALAVPWQRVINREGGISTAGLAQRQMLEAEGLIFSADGRVSLVRYRWHGPDAAWAEAHGCRTLPPREEGEQLSLF